MAAEDSSKDKHKSKDSSKKHKSKSDSESKSKSKRKETESTSPKTHKKHDDESSRKSSKKRRKPDDDAQSSPSKDSKKRKTDQLDTPSKSIFGRDVEELEDYDPTEDPAHVDAEAAAAADEQKSKKKAPNPSELDPRYKLASAAANAAILADQPAPDDAQPERERSPSIIYSEATSAATDAPPDLPLTKPADTTHTGLHLVTGCFLCPALPVSHFTGSLEGAVANALSPLLLTYHRGLKGYVLAHQNARLGGPLGNAQGDMAVTGQYGSMSVWVTAEVLVFRPSGGVWLDGRISLQNESSVGLMVWNVFNATVPKRRLPRGWKWTGDDSRSMSRTRGDRGKLPEYIRRKDEFGHFVDAEGKDVEVGSTVVFRAREFDLGQQRASERALLSIQGSLLSEERDKGIDKKARDQMKKQVRTQKRGFRRSTRRRSVTPVGKKSAI